MEWNGTMEKGKVGKCISCKTSEKENFEELQRYAIISLGSTTFIRNRAHPKKVGVQRGNIGGEVSCKRKNLWDATWCM